MRKQHNSAEFIQSLNRGRIIRFDPEHATDGFYLILNTGQAGCLPDDTYIVGQHRIDALNKAKIPFLSIEKSDLRPNTS